MTDQTSSSATAQPKAQAAAMELMKPGPEHARLAATVGSWNVACSAWMPGNAEPKKSAGTAVISPLFGGRYTREEFNGEFGGQAFQGLGTMGYDRAAKVFVYTWIDNMGTGITRTSGPAVAMGAPLELRGEMTCPMNGHTILRQVFVLGADGSMTVTMYNAYRGQEHKTLELVYTRKG